MAQVVVVRKCGAADVLQIEEVDIEAPKAGEIHINQTAVGVNLHDVYVRSGLYKSLSLSGVPGCEATGSVPVAQSVALFK